MKRPPLESTPLPNPFPQPGRLYITCCPGQWDATLKAAYETGWTLIEIEGEKAVRAFRKPNPTTNTTES